MAEAGHDIADEFVNSVISNLQKSKCAIISQWEAAGVGKDFMMSQKLHMETKLNNFIESLVTENSTEVMKFQINEAKEKLNSLCEECFYSDVQKKRFSSYFSTNISIIVLNDLRRNIEVVQDYYNKNEKVFSLIKKYKLWWDHYVSVEKQSSNPDRFHNRGAQLLKDEKDRRIAKKELPKLESQIKIILEDYQKVHGQPLLLHGDTFTDFICKLKNENSDPDKFKTRTRPWLSPTISVQKRKLQDSMRNGVSDSKIAKFSSTNNKLVNLKVRKALH